MNDKPLDLKELETLLHNADPINKKSFLEFRNTILNYINELHLPENQLESCGILYMINSLENINHEDDITNIMIYYLDIFDACNRIVLLNKLSKETQSVLLTKLTKETQFEIKQRLMFLSL